MLVDNGSSLNIQFRSTFNQMRVDHPWVPMAELLFDFTGDALIHRGRITLAIEIGLEPILFYGYMDFLIVDCRFAYN